MRRLLAALLLTLSLAVPADAQDSPAPQAAPPSEADIQRGLMVLRVFTGAMNEDEVAQELKSQLFACLYENSLSQIGAAAAKVIAANEQLEEGNPQHVYAAAAAACGVRPAGEAEAAPGR